MKKDIKLTKNYNLQEKLVRKNKENQAIKLNLIKKEKKLQEKKKFQFFSILISIFLLLIVIFLFIFLNKENAKNNNIIKNPVQKPEISYLDFYHEIGKTTSKKKVYVFLENEFQEIGTIEEGEILELSLDSQKEKGYFLIKDTKYYVDYKDLVKGEIKEEGNKTLLNYVPFNESIQTKNITNLYFDGNLIFSLNKGLELPILIKEKEYYGVLLSKKLFYIKKDEGVVVKRQNTTLESTNGIAILTYHFVYDSTDKEEERKCKNSNETICLSDTLFKKHLSYMKENGFYTATMEDLERFIDGKIQLPKKTVVLTIDDGYFVQAAIKVLEELDLHATLFLIGRAGNPSDYLSDNLEIHSHSYNLHYTGACPGGQGSPLKCLNRETLLNDLKKSREQLNGTTVFCYPFFEYNDYAISVLKEAGFSMAFIGGRRKIRVGNDKYKLPRYGIISTTYVSDIEKIIN